MNLIRDQVILPINTDNNKFTYNVWKIAFDGKYFWGFDNDTARNVVIFGIDNSSLPHINNYDYDQKYMKVKFNLDNEFPLNKTIDIHTMIIFARAVFLWK